MHVCIRGAQPKPSTSPPTQTNLNQRGSVADLGLWFLSLFHGLRAILGVHNIKLELYYIP